MTLARQVLAALYSTTTSGRSSRFNIQFGSYASFLSYYSFAGPPQEDPAFYGMPTYASPMVWELVTNILARSGWPSASDINVRFYYHNGTSIEGSTQLQQHAVFGQTNMRTLGPSSSPRPSLSPSLLSKSGVRFAERTGSCAPSAAGPPSSDITPTSSSSGGMSLADATSELWSR